MGEQPKNQAEAKNRCKVLSERNGIIYRCEKRAEHIHQPGNREHEAVASEYVYPMLEWRQLFEQAQPILEWVAIHSSIVGEQLAQDAKRTLIKAYRNNYPTRQLVVGK